MEYSYRFRLYPNAEQIDLIERTFGCCRYVFNHYLAKQQDVYQTSRNNLNYYGCCKDLTILKKQNDTAWLQEVDATALQASLQDLNRAFQNFFRRVKRGKYPAIQNSKVNIAISSLTRASVSAVLSKFLIRLCNFPS